MIILIKNNKKTNTLFNQIIYLFMVKNHFLIFDFLEDKFFEKKKKIYIYIYIINQF